VNVVDHRLFNDGAVCEDVTGVGLPTLEHPTTAIENVSGMLGNIDMPNQHRFSAMEFTVTHNNGVGCNRLHQPGKHNIEFRVARQKYMTSEAEIDVESVKYRVLCTYRSTEQGNIETGSPIGSTDRFSVLRFEKIVDGVQETLIDIPAGSHVVNGINYNEDIEAILN
jgi:hypothetical protein